MTGRLVAYAVCWLILLQLARKFSDIWSGERLYRVVRRVRGFTPLGDQVFLGYLRGILPITAGIALALAAVTIVEVANVIGEGPVQPLITGGLLWVGMTLLGIGFAVGAVGRPHFLIPPSIRGCRTVDDILQRETDARA